MRRLVSLAVALLAVLSLLVPVASGFSPAFRTPGGNEWWVEVYVESDDAITSVEARADDGAWHALSKRSWGAWAASFHVPDGSLVEFRATAADGDTALSQRYVWPSGDAASSGGAFAATFDDVRGNEWWVETDVDVNGAVAGVDARVDGGAWRALTLRSWGSWAASVHAPEGSIVEFRARGSDGSEVVSGGYRWTSATPVDGGSGDGGGGGDAGAFDATFRDPSGNAWWVEVDVDATETLAGVDARVDGGGWQALELKSWGDWAKSIHAPEGSIVEFRARGASGASETSGAYRWTSATPVDGTGGSTGSGLRIAVDASVGPWGGARVDIDRPFYGLNIADWEPETYRPDPEPEFLAYLDALDPGVLRWPAGHTSQSTVWERTPGESWGTRWLSTGHFDDFVALTRAVDAEPLIAVNLKTATPAQAADMVRYANLEKGYGITWWQLGNEPDHRDGETSGPDEYARDALDFARAMRAVDPSIRLVGGEIMTGAHVMGTNGAPDWLTPIVEKAGHEFDAISWHYYPLDSNQPSTSSSAYPTVEHLFQETASDWRVSGMTFADEIFPHLKRLRDAHAPGAELWVTEIAEDSGDGGKEGIVGAVAGMLWTADIMGRFAAHGPDGMTKFVFQSGSSHRFTLLDENHDPRPAYYVYWLYARHMGDDFAKATSADRTKVAAHAAIRDDGALTIMLANKETSAHTVSIDVSGFSASSAARYELRGDWYGDETVTLNGQTLNQWNVDGSDMLQPERLSVGDATSFELAPYTVALIVLEP